jgi:hypothetical protein
MTNYRETRNSARRAIRRSGTIVLAATLLLGLVLWSAPSYALTIGGAVKQPLNFTLDDLSKMEKQSARVSELTKDKEYKGTFVYRGVPLRHLLDLANIEKEASSVYKKPLDLAIVVKNKAGKVAVLSWGEVFYKNPGEVLIALSAKPIGPHHTDGCGDCHGKEIYQPALDQMKRTVGYPKVVVVNDFYTDRSLEDVVSIEVVDLKGQSPKKEMKKLFSPGFTVTNGKTKVEIANLEGFRRTEVVQKEVGDGRGYHGLKKFAGATLRDVLAKVDGPKGIDVVILASAPDGYRALFSWAEIFLRPEGERVIIADTRNNIHLDTDGRFILLPPDDLAADRDVKALEKLEIVRIGK